ncbi:hypothetical protein EBZ39_12890 [bacterium]|nr:hypothetical protein [bacterium]
MKKIISLSITLGLAWGLTSPVLAAEAAPYDKNDSRAAYREYMSEGNVGWYGQFNNGEKQYQCYACQHRFMVGQALTTLQGSPNMLWHAECMRGAKTLSGNYYLVAEPRDKERTSFGWKLVRYPADEVSALKERLAKMTKEDYVEWEQSLANKEAEIQAAAQEKYKRKQTWLQEMRDRLRDSFANLYGTTPADDEDHN